MEFSTGSALRFGWETFKKRAWFFVGSTVVILLASGLINGFTSGIDAAGDRLSPGAFAHRHGD